MTETFQEVLQAMRVRHDAMKPGGARNGLKHWLDRFEAAVEPGEFLGVYVHPEGEIPIHAPKPLLSGIFDNSRTQQREKWENGRLGPTQPAERCPRNRPFGSYPDVGGV